MRDLNSPIDRNVALPMYEQLAQLIVDKIGGGQFVSGQRLPTELDLAKVYGVSRDTVRQAIGILERRGLVVRRRPKGTFVAAKRVTQELAELRSFRGGLIDRGVVPEMELLEFRPARPPEEFAVAFNTHEEVMRLLRRYVIDRKPFAVANIYLHPMAKAIPWEVAERHDTYTIFDKFLNKPVARASATIRADSAGRATGPFLDLRPSAPLLLLEQTHYSASGEVLVCSVLRVRADAYELHIDLIGGTAFKDGLTGVPAARNTRGRG
jgi:GntR family transcriptional regulator